MTATKKRIPLIVAAFLSGCGSPPDEPRDAIRPPVVDGSACEQEAYVKHCRWEASGVECDQGALRAALARCAVVDGGVDR